MARSTPHGRDAFRDMSRGDIGLDVTARKRAGSRYALRVTNLSRHAVWKDLKIFTKRFADVYHVEANDSIVGEGVLYFESRSEAKRALRDMDGIKYDVFFDKKLFWDRFYVSE